MLNSVCVFSFMMMLFSRDTVDAEGFYQKWDINNWTTTIGSANTATTITPLPNGTHYLYTDFYRNNDNNGASSIYIPLDFDVGASAGAITPFSLDFDFRFLSGSDNATTFLGFFNLAGDNDGSPTLNWLGVQLSGSSVTGVKRSSAGAGSSSVVSGSGANVLQRVKVAVYNSGGQTLMDIDLYRIDEETFHVTKIGSVSGAVLLASGETLPMGLDVFGVRNTYYPEGSPASHAQMQIDNIYFSTTSENAEWPVPSFSELCVSAVLESTTPLNEFDPWNTTRWAAWYTNGNVLAKAFAPDCDVSFASGRGTASPWEPDISGLPDYQGEIFFFGNASRGITFNGNGTCIDVRQIKPSLSSLYSTSYDDALRHPLHYCIYNTAGNSSALDGTTIKNLWMKGFKQGIHAGVYQTHPLLITGCNFRRNDWGVYLRGTDTTLYNNNISEGAHGGLYLETGSSGNYILGNFWKDNDYQQSIEYGDIVVDASYGNRIENNTHMVATYGDYHAAMKFYRNSGENGVLRENGAHANEIIGNSVDRYSVAYEVGSRLGMQVSYDLSGEARDYASYNLFQSNTVVDTEFGIKINTSGNEVCGNTFSGVTWPILLHNVMYSLAETHIHDQDGTRVSYWVRNSDFTTNSTYADWFGNQDDRNQGIATSDRYTFFTYSGTPGFDNYSGSAWLIKRAGGDASQIIPGSDMKDVYKSAGTPIDVAVGDFWEDNPGDEFAVIWSSPVSMVDGTNYYTIIIYDSAGIEVNRCGKSLVKWKAISAGDFLDARGDEIAAIPETAVNGVYPIYVFSRGRELPSVTNLLSNTTKISALAGGNFDVSDSRDEIAYVLEDSPYIDCCKPGSAWTNRTDAETYMRDIAAGNFDGDSSNGDELVMIPRYLTARAFLYRVGETGYYDYAGPFNITSKFNAVCAGDFDGDGTDEIAVALSPGINGEYPVRCYEPGSTSHFKEISQNVLGVPAKAIGAFSFPIADSLSAYERVEGFSGSDYGSVINNWGDNILVLPSAAQTNAIPAFVVNADPADDSDQYLKVIPILR